MTRRKSVKASCKYRYEYCEMLVEHCDKGFTINSFAATINISQSTLANWFKTFPDFAHAREMALQRRSLKFQQDMINSCEGKIRTNPASYIFALKNCDPENFKDKMEMDHSGQTPIVIDTGIAMRAIDEHRKMRKIDIEVSDIPEKQIEMDEEDMEDEDPINEEDLNMF
jgi:hypothetical protein